MSRINITEQLRRNKEGTVSCRNVHSKLSPFKRLLLVMRALHFKTFIFIFTTQKVFLFLVNTLKMRQLREKVTSLL